MNKETIEGNKLIAEFLTWETDSYELWCKPSYGDGFNPTEPNYPSGSRYKTEDLLFHSSWDWLMPVVEKINKYIFHGDSADCGDDYAFMRTFGMIDVETGQFMVRINRFALFKADSFIEAVWLAVIDFIEFYNSQLKTIRP